MSRDFRPLRGYVLNYEAMKGEIHKKHAALRLFVTCL